MSMIIECNNDFLYPVRMLKWTIVYQSKIVAKVSISADKCQERESFEELIMTGLKFKLYLYSNRKVPFQALLTLRSCIKKNNMK